MNFMRNILVFAGVLLLISPVMAETHEVLMKNRGTAGPMIYEPDYIEINPGDTIKFIRTHKSHNAASIKEMSPEGYKGFIGKIDQEIEVKYDDTGYYGIKCTPHYAQGMIMLVKVGDAEFPQSYREFKAPGLADKRFKKIIEMNVDK